MLTDYLCLRHMFGVESFVPLTTRVTVDTDCLCLHHMFRDESFVPLTTRVNVDRLSVPASHVS